MRRIADPFLDAPTLSLDDRVAKALTEPASNLEAHAALYELYRVAYADGSSDVMMGFDLDRGVRKDRGDVVAKIYDGPRPFISPDMTAADLAELREEGMIP